MITLDKLTTLLEENNITVYIVGRQLSFIDTTTIWTPNGKHVPFLTFGDEYRDGYKTISQDILDNIYKEFIKRL